jgi:ankyrin repeat protein
MGVFVGGVVNGEPEEVRRALALRMPIETYSFAAKTQTPLLYAAAYWGRAGSDVIAVLLEAGADVNAPTRGSIHDGETPLMVAARAGWLGLVRQLIEAGADPNHASASGETALSLASLCYPRRAKGRAKRTDPDPESVVGELLRAGTRSTVDALESAALFGHVGVARLLIAAGADPNGTGMGGTTPLQTAVLWNFPEVVALLLQAGADPRRPYPDDHGDCPGLTPLEAARQERLKKVIPLLEAAANSAPTATPQKRGGKVPKPRRRR